MDMDMDMDMDIDMGVGMGMDMGHGTWDMDMDMGHGTWTWTWTWDIHMQHPAAAAHLLGQQHSVLALARRRERTRMRRQRQRLQCDDRVRRECKRRRTARRHATDPLTGSREGGGARQRQVLHGGARTQQRVDFEAAPADGEDICQGASAGGRRGGQSAESHIRPTRHRAERRQGGREGGDTERRTDGQRA